MNKSIWETNKSEVRTTKKNIETDVLIIGGGITGMTTALNLLNSDYEVTLIEANKIGGIVTKKTTGKISIMQGYNYQEIEKNINLSASLKYLESQIYAVKLIKDLIRKYKIKCDIQKNSSYLFTNEQTNIKKIIKEKDILEKGNIKCDTINNLPNKYPCLYGIKTDSYVFNPLKYINEIRNICNDKINMYENMRALQITKKLDYYLVRTNKNKIKAKKIIICTHYPIFVGQLGIPFRTTIEKEYILNAKVDKVYKANMLCADDELISIRYYFGDDKYIIYASDKSLLCNKLNHKENINSLIKRFRLHFNYPIKYTWYNYDIKSNDYLPIIGKVKDENILIATAYNKWGMTNGVLASKIIADMISGMENEFTSLFDPYRKTNIKKMVNSCMYIYDNLKAYLKAYSKQKRIRYVTENGVEYAIYTDEKNKEHKVVNMCPHMKCKLIFNEFDKTWDCPCHGSRYNIDGKVIKGPSNYSIIKKD